ncbi:MAG: hypothetical protein HZA54_06490 [Planctomycetes bacterium]|nr:hypothetical protein [Planctomycetota bacterium]
MERVAFRELFLRFFTLLETLEVGYFAYGGIAVGVWGDPRETQDVDAVVLAELDDTGRLLRDLTGHGFELPAGSAATFPIDGWVRATLPGRYADLALGRSPFDRSAMKRRVRITLFALPIWVVSAEDLVLYKLIAHRRKDLPDAESVLRRQGVRLDLEYLRSWADEIAAQTGKFEVPGKLRELLEEVGLPGAGA